MWLKKKKFPFGFFVLETKGHIDIKHETETKKKESLVKNIEKKKKKKSGFLNRFDFSYTGTDTVNQAGKITFGLIKNASKEINNVAQQRMNQIIRQGRKEVERVLPKIFREPLRIFIKHLSNC